MARLSTSRSEFSRKTELREWNKKNFFAFEGAETEQRYFKYLIDNESSSNYSMFTILTNSSNPKNIIDDVEFFLRNENVLNFDNIRKQLAKYDLIEKKKLNKILSACKKINNFDIKELDILSKNDIDKIISYIFDRIKSDDLYDKIVKELDDLSTYKKDLDSVSIIVDRDKGSFIETQYEYVCKEAAKNGYNLYVTNPCFEFWLLLHHTDCAMYSIDDLKSNVKCNKETFVYNELKKHDEKYTKKINDFSFYHTNYDIAKKNVKKFENDIKKLNNNIGSNLYKLIDEIYSK